VQRTVARSTRVADREQAYVTFFRFSSALWGGSNAFRLHVYPDRRFTSRAIGRIIFKPAGTCRVVNGSSFEGDDNMQWTTPQFTDLRLGFEITMYIANR